MSKYSINIPMPEKHRSKVTKAVLDWVEDWPKFQGGYIHSLQEVRVRQREEAKETFEQTRPPKGTKLEFYAIRMLEIFQYEEFETLCAGLERMFPNMDGVRFEQPFRMYFEELSKSMTMGGWKMLGWIYREKKPLGPRNCLHLMALPLEVDFIEVSLHKILSSTMVIVLDVHLNDTATSTLTRLQESKYLSEIKVEWLSLREKFFGTSQWTSERSMEQAILGWLTGIRKSIEDILALYFRGCFMKQPSATAKLPAIEVFGLRNHFTPKNDFITWANNARNWWRSLGFQFYFNTYNKTDFAFSWAHSDNYDDLNIAHRIIVFCEQYLKGVNVEIYGGDERHAMAHTMQNVLNGFLAPFSVIEFLQMELGNLETLRSRIYPSMAKGKSKKRSLRKQFDLYGNLQQVARINKRFLLEFDQAEKFIWREFEEIKPEEICYTNLFPERKLRIGNFKEDVSGRIEYLRNTVDNHMNFLDKTFSTYVNFLNVDAIYRLQIVSIALSIIALFAAAGSVLGNWRDILDMFK